MKIYPKYKPSNIEWIANIPEHWEIKRLKNIADFINRGTAPDYVEERDLGVINQATFSKGFFDLSNLRYTKKSNSDSTRGILKQNDILLASTGGGILGKTIIFNLDGNYIGDSHISIIRDTQNRIDARYYFYFLKINYDLINGVLAEGSTNQTELRREWLKDFRVMFPPSPEQTAIANFLDQKTSQVDIAIAKKQRLIELLEEEKRSVIDESVTKGINSKVKFKETNNEWFIEIPENWSLQRLATIGSFSKGSGISRNELTESGFPAILYGDLYTKYDIKVTDIINYTSEESALNSVEIKQGDILFTGSGETKEDIGKCIVYLGDKKAYAGGDLIIFSQNKYDSLFLSYSLNSTPSILQKLVAAKGDIIVHIYSSSLRNIFIPIPPIEEQILIVKYIESHIDRIERTIDRVNKEIDLLKEYLQSLIFEAVTGKIKVYDLD